MSFIFTNIGGVMTSLLKVTSTTSAKLFSLNLFLILIISLYVGLMPYPSAYLAGAFAVDPDFTRRRLHHAAHQPQQRGLAGTTDAHQRDDLAARDRHVDARQYRTLCVRKVDVLDFDEGFGGHGCGGCCRKQRKRF